MSKLFFAIYDDAARTIPFRCYHAHQNTIYRTANMGFIEELSGKGFDPTAMLLEEDITDLKAGNYSNEALSPEDITFLKDCISNWAMAD